MPNPIPRALRMLANYGGAALTPHLERGRYIAPKVSRRVAAGLRKRAIIDGTFGSFSLEQGGGWDPEWDKKPKIYMLRPFKGHVRERNRDTRANKVTTAMEGMPDRIANLQKDVASRKPKKDIAFMFKRLAGLATKT